MSMKSLTTPLFGLSALRRSFTNNSIIGVALAYIQLMRDNDRTRLDLALGTKTPGFIGVGIFLFFGAIMASLAATTLLWRGTPLDRLWDLNPTAYNQLAPLGRYGWDFLSCCSVRPSPRQESGGSDAAFGDGD